MTDAEVAGRALRQWVKEAEAQGRVPHGAVLITDIGRLARHAATLTPEQVADLVPRLAEHAEEVTEVATSGAAPGGNSSGAPAAGPGTPLPAGDAGGSPAVSPPQAPAAPSGSVPDPTQFARYTGGLPGTAPEQVQASLSDQGVLTYSWPPWRDQAGVVLYRVVTSQTTRPFSPEDGAVLLATTDTTAVDDSPSTGMTWTVQVWANVGGDEPSALAAQPQLWAEKSVVAPVRHASAAPDHGAIVASWQTAPGVERVRVYRLPAATARSVLAHQLGEHAIQPEARHLYGITDNAAVPGAEYVYRMVAEAQGSWSPPVDLTVQVPYEAREVTDLVATILRQPDPVQAGAVALQWTQPQGGQVRIYRSATVPPAGLVGKIVSQAALQQTGLTTPVPNAPEPTEQPGVFRMSNVQWPAGWTSAYFIPVTVMGEEVLAGRAERVIGVPAPRSPELSHRGYLQVVSFGWPEGAGTVRVHLAPRGADPAEVVEGRPVREIDREHYIKEGGVRLELRPGTAADVILTAWVTGQKRSEPVVVSAEPRLFVHYSMAPQRTMKIGPVRFGRVVVWNEQDARQAPPFVVVFNTDRLPLHAEDGEQLEIVPDDTPDAAPTRGFRPAALNGGPQGAAYRAIAPKKAKGYARLFVAPSVAEETRRRVLVLDPPVASLTWT